MKRRSDSEAEALALDAQQAATGPAAWDAWLDQHAQPARIEFPTGELFDEAIAGFVLAWRLQGKLKPLPVLESDSFNANGLEGKIAIETDLIGALLVFKQLPKYRRQIYY